MNSAVSASVPAAKERLEKVLVQFCKEYYWKHFHLHATLIAASNYDNNMAIEIATCDLTVLLMSKTFNT